MTIYKHLENHVRTLKCVKCKGCHKTKCMSAVPSMHSSGVLLTPLLLNDRLLSLISQQPCHRSSQFCLPAHPLEPPALFPPLCPPPPHQPPLPPDLVLNNPNFPPPVLHLPVAPSFFHPFISSTAPNPSRPHLPIQSAYPAASSPPRFLDI